MFDEQLRLMENVQLKQMEILKPIALYGKNYNCFGLKCPIFSHKATNKYSLKGPYGDLFQMSTFILSPSHAFHLYTNFWILYFSVRFFIVSSIKRNIESYILENDDWEMKTTIGITMGFFFRWFKFNNNNNNNIQAFKYFLEFH